MPGAAQHQEGIPQLPTSSASPASMSKEVCLFYRFNGERGEGLEGLWQFFLLGGTPQT